MTWGYVLRRTAIEPKRAPAKPRTAVRFRPPPQRVVPTWGSDPPPVGSAALGAVPDPGHDASRRRGPTNSVAMSMPLARSLSGGEAFSGRRAGRVGSSWRHDGRVRSPQARNRGVVVPFVRSCRGVVQARYERPYGWPGTIVRIAEGAVPAHHGGAFLI